MDIRQKSFCIDLCQFAFFFSLVITAALFILTGGACFLAFIFLVL